MLKGNTLGVVVGNYSKELSSLKGQPNIHFAEGFYAAGVIQGIQHYRFLDDIIDSESNGTETSAAQLPGPVGFL